MFVRPLLLLTGLLLLLASCSDAVKKTNAESSSDRFISAFEKTNDKIYADSLVHYLLKHPEYHTENPVKVEAGIRIAGQAFIRESMRKLFTDYLLSKERDDIPDALLFLAEVHRNELADEKIANFIYLTFVEEYSDDVRWDSIAAIIPSDMTTTEDLIANVGRNIFSESGMLLSRLMANDFMQYAELYALSKPDNPRSPDYLFQASEIAKSLELYDRSLFTTRWIIDRFPEHEMAAKALFLKAFTYDESDLNQDRAIELYQEFVDRYPDHALAESAKLLKEKASLTDEQILKRLRGGMGGE